MNCNFGKLDGAALISGLGLSALAIPASATPINWALGLSVQTSGYGYQPSIANAEAVYNSSAEAPDGRFGAGITYTQNDPGASLTYSPNPTLSLGGLSSGLLNLTGSGGGAQVSASLATGATHMSASSSYSATTSEATVVGANMSDQLTFSGSGIITIGFSLDGNVSLPATFDGVANYSIAVTLTAGAASLNWTDYSSASSLNPPSVNTLGRWNTSSVTGETATGFHFQGTLTVTNGEVLNIDLIQSNNCNDGATCSFQNTGQLSLIVPTGVTYTSSSGVFLTQTSTNAAPTITSVVNSGSNDARLNPGGDATIYGTNLGANISAGTTVTVGSTAAYVIWVTPNQVNIEIPPTIATGPTTVTVTVPGNGSSNAFAINLAAYAPSFQYTTFAPPGPIVALNSLGATFIGPGSKARPNQLLSVYLFGLGPTNPAEPLGVTPSSPLYNTTTTPTFMIDNLTTQPVLFSGLALGFVGTYQVNLRVPGGAKPGPDPVALSIGGFNTDPGTLYIGAIDRDFTATGNSGALLYDPVLGQSYTALSNGNGTYAYIGNLFSPSFDTLLTGDFNGDGRSDLVLYNSKTASAYIGLGKGDGTFNFQSLFWSAGYNDIESGDIDGDGTTDFVLYNSTTGTLYTAISNGSGGFTYKYHLVSIGLSFVRLADINGDGKADLILYNKTDGTASYGIGDGAGNFAFTSALYSPGYDIGSLGDLNNDGKADFILYNSSNGAAATFISGGAITPLVFSPGFTSVGLADYNGSGKASVTVYNKNTGVNNAYFGVGNGDGTFTFQSLFWSPGYNVVDREDVNGDGKIDVVLYNNATGTEYTGISKGNGTFTYTYSYWGLGKTIAQ